MSNIYARQYAETVERALWQLAQMYGEGLIEWADYEVESDHLNGHLI